jgi:hypothetical protein
VASVIPFLRELPRRPATRPQRSWLARARSSRYFWPLVGAGAAVIGAAVGVGIYFGTRESGADAGRRLVVLPAVPAGHR